jgi:hypothetical protein
VDQYLLGGGMAAGGADWARGADAKPFAPAGALADTGEFALVVATDIPATTSSTRKALDPLDPVKYTIGGQ